MADRPLRIAVDGRELVGKPTGVGRYVREVLRVWTHTPIRHQVAVITHAPPDPALVQELPGVVWHEERSASAGTRWEQGRLPRALARISPDVLFAPAYTGPLRLPCPMVLLVHDVSYFAHPEWFSRRDGFRRRWLTRVSARRAHVILTVSRFSADEIIRYLRVASSRVVLAPPGAPAVEGTSAAPRTPLLLFVGSLLARRHIPELIRAFSRLPREQHPDARLVLVGDNRTLPRIDPRALAAACGVADRVECREYVDETALGALYRQATGFVFLSDYEGFAMTPLEALAHGVPSVLLDTPVAREVYGDAALMVPLEDAAIAEALGRLLGDPALRQRLLDAGRARLAAFSWTNTAGVVLRALEDAAR